MQGPEHGLRMTVMLRWVLFPALVEGELLVCVAMHLQRCGRRTPNIRDPTRLAKGTHIMGTVSTYQPTVPQQSAQKLEPDSEQKQERNRSNSMAGVLDSFEQPHARQSTEIRG